MKLKVIFIMLISLFTVEAYTQNVLISKENDTLKISTKNLPDSLKAIMVGHKIEQQVEEINQRATSNVLLNNTYAVGTTGGNADVSSTGAATYQIPIEVPNGIAGLEPSINIIYNSQAGNGSLGYRWNLSASSAISRSGKTYYYDDTTEAPSLSSSDNLMLDGQRLILISGQNLSLDAKYRTEYDPFTEIAYKMINAHLCFVVRTKDGTTLEYEVTGDSYIESQDGYNPLLWLLSKRTDVNGNSITYSYDEVTNNGEVYLNSIQYAGNRSVKFSYSPRNDKEVSYFAGASINQNKILKNISTWIGGTKINEYRFDHEFDGYYSKLKNITQYGQNGEQFNPTTIDYGNSDYYHKENFMFLSENREGNKPLFADFNGDGRMDFLSYPEKTSYAYGDKATLFLASSHYGLRFDKAWTIWLNQYFSHFIIADVNGDERMDLVMVSRDPQDNNYIYDYYESSGNQMLYHGRGFKANGRDGIAGDFNGDGKYEILVKESQQVFDGNGNQIASGGIDNWGQRYFGIAPNDRYLHDFNGNGKTDIMVMNDDGYWVYELNGTSFRRLDGFSGPELKNYHSVYFGDFNGDRLTDVLKYYFLNETSPNVTMLLSTGTGFVQKEITNSNIRLNNPAIYNPFIVGDFNKDGKSDIFHIEVINNSIQMKVGTFNGTNFTTAYYLSNVLTPEDFHVSYRYGDQLFQVADFDGDGRSEFCSARFIDAYIINSFTDEQTLLAKSISNGLGGHTSFEYAPITDESYCYNTTGDVSFPVSGSTFPLYVAVNMNVGGNSYSENISYYYKNPKVHKKGKGFLGFGEIEVRNTQKNVKTATKYGYNEYYYPFVTEQKTMTGSGSEISTTSYDNAYVYQSAKRVTPYIKKETKTNHLTGVVETLECTEVSSAGIPLKIVTNYGNDLRETVNNRYYTLFDENTWRLLPMSIEKTTKRGDASVIDKLYFEYNEKYLLKKKNTYTFDGTRQVSEETFEYDSFGNAKKATTKAYSSSNVLATNYEYSTDGVFRTKVTDPMGLSTTSHYNSLGQIDYSIDPRNNKTSYAYDNMGRLSMTTYPDGVFSTTGLSWDSSVGSGIYCITDFQLGEPTVKTYYDALGRELRKSLLRFDNSEIHTDKQYDSAGRLYQESMPFKGSSATQWNTYSYDNYNRLKQVAYASGKTDSYSYLNNRITETIDGIASTKEYNAKGELIKVSDPGGDIYYNLKPDGQPFSIVAPGNVVTGFYHDDYGRQTAILDPSAGNKYFGYDDDGNINRETDANDKNKIMEYDQFCRIKKKILPEFSATYYYNSYGSPDSIVSNHGVSTQYTYDTFGRLMSEKESYSNRILLKKTYDYYHGNVSSVKYTSVSGAIGEENYNYSYGHLTEIKFNNQIPIWKLNGENALGLPTEAKTGNLTRNYSYDQYGLPTGRIVSGIQQFSYKFNSITGNLEYRKDNRYGIQENFDYDNLNRLTKYAGKTASYNEKSNLTRKSEVGDYNYNTPGKPYAISGITTSSDAIPIRNQSITYTSYERPNVITEGEWEAFFQYNTNGERVKMQIHKNGQEQMKYYYFLNCYEYQENYNKTQINERLYLGGDYYSAPAVYIKKNTGNWEIYYICRDYLGSITHITNSSGSLVQELSYDAWGRLRNPANQTVYNPDNQPELFLGRGYTGHEHLSMFGLINMNARLYDPAVGRFLSPDPYVQMPDFTQNFNRYSYCLNNPLRYTDPSGEWFFVDDLIAAAVGGVINVAVNAIQGNIHSWGQGFSLFGVGAGAGIGTIYGGPLVGGAIIGAGNSFVNQAFGADGKWNWDNINYDNVAMGGLVGAGMGYAGAKVTGMISPYVSSLTSQLGGPVVQQVALQGITGAATGFTLGTGAALMNGDNLKDALKTGGQGALLGLTTGFISGMATGFQQAHAAKVNPWTGNKTLYRAVSTNEFNDIKNNGFRPDPSGKGYQEEKLFYESYKDAVQNTKAYDARYGQKSIIVKVTGPNTSIYNKGYMDGYDVISISKENLHLLKLK